MKNNIQDAIASLWGSDIGVKAVPTLHHFVIKNDWAAALAGSEGFAAEVNDWRLPYDACAFDFSSLGMVVLTLPVEPGDKVCCIDGSVWIGEEGQFAWGVITKVGQCWRYNTDTAIVDIARDRVRAVCIALDAGLAEITEQPAPKFINATRSRKGKPPLPMLRIVNLAARHRRNIKAGCIDTRKVRCHFRRGHWRHIDSGKTWVKWCLVGDSALGYVAHEYTI